MLEMLAFDFMQRALLAAVIVSILCGFIAFFVVLKRLSFIGMGISHSAFGGVAIGVLLGIDPILSSIVFVILMAWAIGLVSKKGDVHEDTAIGIFYSFATALGVVLISLSKSYNVDLFGYLFGSILSVTTQDLWTVGILGAIVLGLLLLFFKELLFISFDEEVATISGLPVTFLYFLLLTLMAVTIVIAIKVVGIILVSAFIVIPAATGYQLTKSYRAMLIASILSGVIASIIGLWLSFRFDLASGATIVLCSTLLFFLTMLIAPHRRFMRPVLSSFFTKRSSLKTRNLEKVG